MRRRARKQESAEVNMTPMLDIVFILLIFFIVTSTFLQEQGLDMAPKPTPEDQPENPNPPPTILVQIDDASRIFINGQITDVSRVAAALQRQMAENGRPSAVAINPHAESDHGVVTRVFKQAGDAKAVGVVIQEPDDL